MVPRWDTDPCAMQVKSVFKITIYKLCVLFVHSDFSDLTICIEAVAQMIECMEREIEVQEWWLRKTRFFTFWFRNSELEMIKNVRFRSQTDIDLAIWIIKNVTTVISLRFSNIPGKDFGKYKIETKAVEWCDLVVCGTNWVWRKRAIFTQGYSKLRLPDDIFYWDYIEFRIHARK